MPTIVMSEKQNTGDTTSYNSARQKRHAAVGWAMARETGGVWARLDVGFDGTRETNGFLLILLAAGNEGRLDELVKQASEEYSSGERTLSNSTSLSPIENTFSCDNTEGVFPEEILKCDKFKQRLHPWKINQVHTVYHPSRIVRS